MCTESKIKAQKKAGILLQNRISGNEKRLPSRKMKASKCSRARRIRTFKMTESESAALPFGYSPIIYVNDISVGYEL